MRGFSISANGSLESDVINLWYIRILIKIREKEEENTHNVPGEVTVKDEIKAGERMLVTNHNSLSIFFIECR